MAELDPFVEPASGGAPVLVDDRLLDFLAAVRALRAAERSADLHAVRHVIEASDVEALRDALIAANLIRIAPVDGSRRSLVSPTFFLTPAGVAALDRLPRP